MEDGLVLSSQLMSNSYSERLNPYCSGRWSRTVAAILHDIEVEYVLILIVVEDGLVPTTKLINDIDYEES